METRGSKAKYSSCRETAELNHHKRIKCLKLRFKDRGGNIRENQTYRVKWKTKKTLKGIHQQTENTRDKDNEKRKGSEGEKKRK